MVLPITYGDVLLVRYRVFVCLEDLGLMIPVGIGPASAYHNGWLAIYDSRPYVDDVVYISLFVQVRKLPRWRQSVSHELNVL